MSEAPERVLPGRSIKQQRGRKTYDALVATGFELLEEKELEDITIAELAQKAGYSVGAFYARFRSKDEFFDAMIADHLDERRKTRRKQFADLPADVLIAKVIDDTVSYYWGRRRFWRAALIRSIREPDFWEPLRGLGHEFASSIIAHIAERAERKLTKSEQTNVRFALQLVLGTINNAIINRPGPILIGQKQFVESLVRAFKLVSEYDVLVGAARS